MAKVAQRSGDQIETDAIAQLGADWIARQMALRNPLVVQCGTGPTGKTCGDCAQFEKNRCKLYKPEFVHETGWRACSKFMDGGRGKKRG